MKKHKHMWRLGKLIESNPSEASWWAGLVILIFTLVILVETILAGGTIDYLLRKKEIQGIIGLAGIWVFFRLGILFPFRSITALEHKFITFPKLRKKVQSFPSCSSLAIINTSYDKSYEEIYNALCERVREGV